MMRKLAVLAFVAGFLSPGYQQPRAMSPVTIAGGGAVVATGDDLQDALDRVQPGQTIVLEPGRTYRGPFTLPVKAGDGWITIRGDAASFDRRVPAGRRVTPDDAPLMPRLVSANGPVIEAAPGAHHYRFIGVEMAPVGGVSLENVIVLGTDSSDPAAVPHDFAFERVYVHGDPVRGSRRGLALNSAATSVVDSWFADFKDQDNDAQAICGWNGPGPFRIVNSYLEASGENLMFGGGDPSIEGLVPSDITIERNRLAKVVAWRTPDDRTPAWVVKNLLELKNARRVVINGNTLEYTWTAAQVGYAVLFTPRNQDGTAPWSVVEDVTFTNNTIRHVANGIHLLGRDDNHPSGQLRRVRIANNLFEDVGGSWGDGRLFLLIDGTADVVIDHNTATQTEAAVFAGETVPHTGFVFTNNIVNQNEYGIIGSGAGPGNPSIERFFPGAVVRRNAFVGGSAGNFPSDNFFPGSMAALQFARQGNFRLLASSPLHAKATDGTDVGVDMDALVRATGRYAVPRTVRQGGMPWVALVLLWASTGLIGYAYAGYPALLWISARLSRRPVRRRTWHPRVTVLVVAHNESARIARRVRNIAASRYPADRLDILVVSDGSTDDTAAVARLASPRARVIASDVRRGKAAVFNDVIPTLQTDIVVLADARQRFAPDAIEELVADLADPAVGAVSGELVLVADAETETDVAAAQGAGLYWRYEKCIRAWESDVDSCVGVTGAITALRRSLFERLPVDTVLDDMLIPLRIIGHGYRVVFEPRARAYDGLPVAARDELARKARTLAGNFQLFARERWLFNPRRDRVWFQLLSHKGLRLALPVLFLVSLIANATVATSLFYQATLAAQIVFYLLALAGGLVPSLRKRVRWIVLPYTICFLSLATVVAFLRFVRREQTATWQRASIREPV
jgi:cellulose synthase/poly-beta-1,6-N-acetylglucosamine synthase-like glycosyltransferase